MYLFYTYMFSVWEFLDVNVCGIHLLVNRKGYFLGGVQWIRIVNSKVECKSSIILLIFANEALPKNLVHDFSILTVAYSIVSYFIGCHCPNIKGLKMKIIGQSSLIFSDTAWRQRFTHEQKFNEPRDISYRGGRLNPPYDSLPMCKVFHKCVIYSAGWSSLRSRNSLWH